MFSVAIRYIVTRHSVKENVQHAVVLSIRFAAVDGVFLAPYIAIRGLHESNALYPFGIVFRRN